MDLQKLLEMQKALDTRIKEEKSLQGKDLVPNTFVALQVELAEFANEAKWFKHWSTRQTPTVEQEKCDYCGEFVDYTRPSPFMGDNASMCKPCWDMTKDDYAGSTGEHILNFEDYPHFKRKEPKKLLEEFVDSLHFFLSIAIQKGWEDALYIYEEQLDPDEFDGDLTGWYLEMTYFLNKSYFENPNEEFSQKWKSEFGFPAKQYWFRTAWIMFLNIGINGFGFTLDQIYEAYLDKNKVNHERQANNY